MSQVLGTLTAETFLRDYWQKRPLLIRQAIPGYSSPVSPEELAGLACEPEVESRLILEKDGESPWQLEHGPFDEERFSSLPRSHWTLLVQEANKHVPDLALLQDRFDFIPNWRLDDVMVSFAPEHGTVGPHADNYDVFLLQAQGRRRWQINSCTPGPEDLISGLPLRILNNFTAEEEWILEPGDMLYLPPGIAHHGVALESCITVSVGYRAPSHIELVAAFAQDVISNLDVDAFYHDPDLMAQTNPGIIDERARSKIRAFLRALVRDEEDLDGWFGRFVTATRPGHDVPEPAEALDIKGFTEALSRHGELWRSEYCRFSFIENTGGGLRLFVRGEELPLPPQHAFAGKLLCGSRHWPAASLASSLRIPEIADLFVRLHNSGCIYFPEDE